MDILEKTLGGNKCISLIATVVTGQPLSATGIFCFFIPLINGELTIYDYVCILGFAFYMTFSKHNH